jgi:hypothetical protein
MNINFVLNKRYTRSGEIIERFCQTTVLLDKTSIEIAKAQKWLHFFNSGRGFLIIDDHYLCWIYLHAIGRDNEAKVLCFGDMEFAFFDCSLKPCILESLKD